MSNANEHSLSGEQLRDAFGAATGYLAECAKAVDAINVYPVPDGDTGSNMAATLREACDYALALPEPVHAGDVLEALARGALYGGRGNSGVILSQALRGLVKGASDAETLDGQTLARGLGEAAAAAYRAVAEPAEGTMLTVLRAAAGGAASAPDQGPLAGFEAALAAAEAAEALTIDQLPALREAGVTDAGGEGICVILRGLVAALRGERPKPVAVPDRPIATLAGHSPDGFGYCTEFVLEAGEAPVAVDALRQHTKRAEFGSVVIVGDERALRVHVHTDKPEQLLAEVAAFGRVTRPKYEDMTAQHERFRAEGSGAGARTALLALSSGAGFDRVFQSLGAYVHPLGEIVKPAAGDIATAADALGYAEVIVIPNHQNVIPAAEQALGLARCALHVLPTTSLAEGAAVAIAFNPAASAADNIALLAGARSDVRAVEVTRAAADRTADGVSVQAGEAIVLVDGKLLAATDDPVDAMIAGIDAAGAAEAAIVTIYTGADFDGTATELSARCEAAFEGVEVEVVRGDQPLYELVAAVER